MSSDTWWDLRTGPVGSGILDLDATGSVPRHDWSEWSPRTSGRHTKWFWDLGAGMGSQRYLGSWSNWIYNQWPPTHDGDRAHSSWTRLPHAGRADPVYARPVALDEYTAGSIWDHMGSVHCSSSAPRDTKPLGSLTSTLQRTLHIASTHKHWTTGTRWRRRRGHADSSGVGAPISHPGPLTDPTGSGDKGAVPIAYAQGSMAGSNPMCNQHGDGTTRLRLHPRIKLQWLITAQKSQRITNSIRVLQR